MNTYEFWYLTIFIGLELALITLFIIGCFAAKIYFDHKARKANIQVDEILAVLVAQEPLSRRYLEYIDLVLMAFKTLDEQNVADWPLRRIELMRSHILPQARAFIHHKNWQKRYLLIRCFEYDMEPEDEAALIKLINDPTPIISFNAMRLACKFDTKPVYQAILEKLKLETHPFHALTINALLKSTTLEEVLSDYLSTSSDPWLKKICYELILALGSHAPIFKQAQIDASGNNINLKIAAIHVLPLAGPEQYLEIYKELFQSEDWRVRNAVVNALRDKVDANALEILSKALTDSSWWVRFNAAKTLNTYGDVGRLLLTEFTSSLLPHHEDASYFLKINKIQAGTQHD